jgi:hypothetical protein
MRLSSALAAEHTVTKNVTTPNRRIYFESLHESTNRLNSLCSSNTRLPNLTGCKRPSSIQLHTVRGQTPRILADSLMLNNGSIAFPLIFSLRYLDRLCISNSSAVRVMRLVNLPQSPLSDVRINLRGQNVRVT